MTLVLAGIFSVMAILPQSAQAFSFDDIIDPFGILPPLPSLPALPGFNNSNSTNQPTVINNTNSNNNINSNNINSNIQSPGAVVNGATNVTSSGRGDTSVSTFDSGYVVAGSGTAYTPNPTPYPVPTPYYPPAPQYNYNNDYNYYSGTSYNPGYNYNNGGTYYTYQQPLSVTCGVNATNATVGNPVGWYAYATGGNGAFQYSWSGTDGLTGSNSTLSIAYNYTGVKTANVTVWSNGQSVVRNCGSINVSGSQPIYTTNYNSNIVNSGVSCSANLTSVKAGEVVVWTANIPAYTAGSVTWSGTDSLYGTGSSLRTTYLKTGTKKATVSVQMTNGQTATAACTNSIYVSAASKAPVKTITKTTVKTTAAANTVLDVACMPNTDAAKVGDTVVWSSNVSGGNGSYKYQWSGSDDLNGVNTTIFKTYSTNGSKAAALTVTSGTQTITQMCAGMVSIGDGSLTAQSAFSLNGIPWGLISILVILVLIASVGYLLFSNKNKI